MSASFLVSVGLYLSILLVIFGSLVFFAETGSNCVVSFSCAGGPTDRADCTLLLFDDAGEIKVTGHSRVD